jgi:hypothetical protein
MNTTAATATKKFAFATLAAPVLAALAIGLAGAAHADSSGPETTISVQDQGSSDGARVETQAILGATAVQDQGASDGARVETQAIQGTVNSSGIQGTLKPATDGTTTAPLMDAVPQYTAS